MDDQGQITAKRDAAARARRLTAGVNEEDIRRRMLTFAAALDAEADALERSLAKPPAPSVTRMQTQMQMQQGAPVKVNPVKDQG